MLSLEIVINQAVVNQDDPETCQNMDDTLYTLAAMIRPGLPEKKTKFVNFPQQANQLLSIALNIFNNIKVSDETAAFIGDIAYNIIRGVRATADDNVLDAAAVKQAQEQADAIMKQLNGSYPEVYQQIVVDTDDIDLFVLNKGSFCKKPGEGLVAAKKVILNNNLVSVVKEKLINPKIASVGRNKVWGKNLKDITTLLSVNDTEFLLDNLPEDGFQNLLLNTLNFLAYDENVVQLALGHLCHKLVWQNDQQEDMQVDDSQTGEIIKSRVLQYRLEMAVLPYFYYENSACRKIIIDSFFGKKSELISCLSSISDEHPDKKAAVCDKLRLFVTTELAQQVMADVFIWQNISILALVLPAIKEKVVWNQINVDKTDMVR